MKVEFITMPSPTNSAAPPYFALLSVNVEFITVPLPVKYIPPPLYCCALLFMNVEFITKPSPLKNNAPPLPWASAELSLNVEFITVA